MRVSNFLKIVVLVAGFALLSGCSSCSDAGEGNSNSADTNLTGVVSPVRDDSKAPVSDNSNSKMVPYAGNGNGENPTLDQSKVKVIDMSKAKPEPMRPRVMSDGSEILTTQTADGSAFVETRSFKNNKQLSKMERITKSGNDRVIKVHLKNGKTLTFANNKIKDFATDSPEMILTAAGIKVDAPPVATPESKKP